MIDEIKFILRLLSHTDKILLETSISACLWFDAYKLLVSYFNRPYKIIDILSDKYLEKEISTMH
jgi:hypothetical protein